MRSCDAVIANLTPFRGASADAGTAFEVGFMRALGRPVLGYTNTPLDYVPRADAVRALPAAALRRRRPGVAIEDFDLAENLMIEIAIEASGSRLDPPPWQPPGQEMTDLTAFRVCLEEAGGCCLPDQRTLRQTHHCQLRQPARPCRRRLPSAIGGTDAFTRIPPRHSSQRP